MPIVPNTCSQKGKSEPLVFPTVYGGIVIDNTLEHYMLNDLSIKALKWLRDEQDNGIARRLVHDIDCLEAEKVAQIKDYAQTLCEKAGNGEKKIPVSVKIKQLIEEKKLSTQYIPNEYLDSLVGEVTRVPVLAVEEDIIDESEVEVWG